jgi:hypothetical protein
VKDSCEYGIKFQVPESDGNIFEYPHNWRLLKKGPAPWSLLVFNFRFVFYNMFSSLFHV